MSPFLAARRRAGWLARETYLGFASNGADAASRRSSQETHLGNREPERLPLLGKCLAFLNQLR